MRRTQMVQTLSVIAWVALLSFLVSREHYGLPTPKSSDVDENTGMHQFNEANALQLVGELSSPEGGIHYRIVGTQELVAAENHLLETLYRLKQQLDASELSKTHEMEIWHQLGDGAHLFDFMGKKVWKQYFELSNIIVRLSSRQHPRSKEDAILVNAHLDSTLPSPGAADDLAGVSVMMEALRVLTKSTDPLQHAVIFLFNGAEESLQDASHLYITKHHQTKDTVRAVINLEAAGTGGREIVFQATSDAMIEAYSHVPHPYATVLASEIFKTGIIVSDTDFRQFEQYGNLTGLDMALVENSYLYHTTKDTVDRLQPGSLTNMGENLLALLRHLCSDSSPPLTAIEPIRSTVYFSILGRIFISYPADKGTLFYATHLIVFVSYLLRFEKRSQWRSRMYALAGVPLSFLAAILSTNFVALLMTLAKKTLSWYRYEFFSVVLFGPPAVFGMLTTQYFVLKIARARGMAGFNMENATLSAVGLFLAIVALVGHVLGAHSSYILALSSFSLTFSLFINDGLTAKSPWDVALSTYLLASFPTTIVGAESFMGFLEIFVPLGGRSGHDAPFDFIIASAIGGITFLSAPWVLPYAHRHGLAGLRRLVFAFGAISLALVVIFMNVSPFDADHPKRLFALHMTNLSTTPPTFALHVAGMDGGPAFEPLVMQTADAVGLDSSKLERNVISDSIPDWDIIYPISQFLLSYKVPLPPPSADFKMPVADTFKVTLEKSSLNPVKKQRSLQLKVDHPGIIWSVIAFTGDVVEWSLPEPPERGALRHHVKEASRYSRNHWTLDLTLQLTESEFEAAQRMSQRAKGQRSTKDLVEVEADRTLGGLRIDFSGLDEKGIWEAKRETYIAGTIPGMEFFRGMKSVLGDEIDSMMLTAVAGVAYL